MSPDQPIGTPARSHAYDHANPAVARNGQLDTFGPRVTHVRSFPSFGRRGTRAKAIVNCELRIANWLSAGVI